ncbi:MAG: TetR/AcrR family transcriptional regulator [Alcaligenaceae bacterium]|nr:TetR/AcrR family transcriptional regulator [Alcaligenaceae bacterium]
MRVKSETRREAMLEIALDLFREVGFDAASMSQIAARVGGSKGTLYNYFSSKEELLLEAMLASAEKKAQEVRLLLQQSDDLSTQLHNFVVSLLKLINSPETTQILRVAISVGGTTDIGKRFYEMGTHEPWMDVADVLQREMSRRNLPLADPDLMAMHLRDLCQSDLIRNLLGAGHEMSDQEAQRKATYIVSVFLRTYGITQ